MAHKCKCPKCNIEFDRDKIQAVKIGARRYGHATCYPESKDFVPLEVKPENDPDYKALMEYIYKLFGDNTNYALVKKQIKKFKEENKYSYSGIMKALIYFYEIKHNNKDKANNAISIVPFIYQDAYNYYYNLFISQQNLQKTGEYKYEEKERIIKPPKSKGIIKKLFKLQEVNEYEE